MIKHQLPKKNFITSIERVSFSDDVLDIYRKKRKPVIFTNMNKNWKAKTAWNIDYLIKKCGKRRIFVKDIKKNLKSSFFFEQALRKLQDQYKKSEKNGLVIQMAQIMTGVFSRGQASLGPLEKDILIPTSISRRRITEVNFWAGSGNTVTELHYDPVDNLLTIIKGKKNIIIFAPDQTNKLYNAPPQLSRKSLTHSFVNIQKINKNLYPKVLDARYYECILSEGDTLFLPSGYWHVVESIGFNMAVNIWWIPNISNLLKKPVSSFWVAEFWSRIRGNGTCVPHGTKQNVRTSSFLRDLLGKMD